MASEINCEHNWEAKRFAGTCQVKAHSYDVCSHCNEVRVETEATTESGRPTTDANGWYDIGEKNFDNHEWDEDKQVVMKAPTCFTNGRSLDYCPHCSVYQENTLPAIHHENYVEGSMVDAIAPTCTTEGSYAHFICADCGEKIYIDDDGNYVIYSEDWEAVKPALRHTTENGTCDTCGEKIQLTADDIKAKIQRLIDQTNNKTGKSDADLTSAVNSLISGYGQNGDAPLPIEVATEAEMTALLETAEIGSVYKYVGASTDIYANGVFYIVEAVE